MLYTSDIMAEVNYRQQELLRRAKQCRLIREARQTEPRTAKPHWIINAVLTSIRLG